MPNKKLFELFKGLTRAHGTYKVTGHNSEKNKVEGKAVTIQNEVTTDLWRRHTEGEQGLGVVPINDDNECNFAAIDIDIYDIDLNALEEKLRKLELPLVLCRTKSGGAHLYFFLAEPTSAAAVRERITQWAIGLGFPGVEIFPKQDYLAGPEDVGNWLNMPYFDAEQTTRYCIKDGKALELNEFIEFAYSKRVHLDDVIELDLLDPQDGLEGAPPCLRTLAANGIPEGTRNNALYNFAVLAKLMDAGGEQWPDTLGKFNINYMQPPLPLTEVNALIKSLGKKEYFYKCKDAPCQQVCNKDICRKAEFGIGGNGDDPGVQIDGLTKICSSPPIWIVQVAGARLQMDTDEFMAQQKFAKKCIEAINFFPMTLKTNKWKQLINSLLREVREIEAPDDAGAVGQFLYQLEQFCTNRSPANSMDEMLLGKPWHEHGRTYFRSADLFKYLEQQRFRDVKGSQVYAVLQQNKDVLHHFKNMKGKGVNYWSVPSFEQQDKEFDVPTIPNEEF
jgi:hypothetical protein